jgi:phosphohistidine phosphatase SixA
VIFLVRHAERADDAPSEGAGAMDPDMAQDPPLSEAGKDRARLLAEMLRDAGITRIYSTNYRRTLETAEPLARTLGAMEIQIYDGSDLPTLATSLSGTPGRHLVVGHSNTTPELVQLLGGDPGPAIEALEYDRLYVVIPEEGEARTVLLRFGQPFQ